MDGMAVFLGLLLLGVLWALLQAAVFQMVRFVCKGLRRCFYTKRERPSTQIFPRPDSREKYVPTSGYRKYLPFLVEKQNGLCGICKGALPDDWGEVHVDHINPKSRGGTDAFENLQAACASCNLRKGPRRMDELTLRFYLNLGSPRDRWI